jgi:Ca2+-binding EF-hand superfamily protein
MYHSILRFTHRYPRYDGHVKCPIFPAAVQPESSQMSLIFSLVSGIASGLFRAGRDAYNEASEKSAQAKAAADALPNAVTNTQGQSLQEKQRLAALAAQGKPTGSFAQHYQSQLAKSVDTDGDGKISKSELEKQVVAGGGTSAQAGTLYQAMDKNKDGTVSADELKDSIPVPKTAMAEHILHMLQAAREAQAAKGPQSSGASPAGSAGAPAIGGSASTGAGNTQAGAQAAARVRMPHPADAGHVLAALAAQLPARS